MIGACAFLGIMQKIPLTAIIFLLELTRGKAEFLMPLTLAMAGAMLTDKLYQSLRK
ncbi:MAG: chloride channel protein [Haemophilus paraphrohaemolyticus]|nr:chloride channel protein [Haemophilus paraphrohaemolyticus]